MRGTDPHKKFWERKCFPTRVYIDWYLHFSCFEKRRSAKALKLQKSSNFPRPPKILLMQQHSYSALPLPCMSRISSEPYVSTYKQPALADRD